MKTLSLLFGLVVVLMVLPIVTYGQAPSTPTQTASPSMPTQAASATPAPALETQKIAVLEAQLQTMKDYDERLLNTVYWSLGAVGAVVLLVVTLGWYTNFRIYKGDVEVIRNEVNTSLEESKLRLQVDASTKLMELQTNLEKIVTKRVEHDLWKSTRDIRILQYEMNKIEARRWEARGVNVNALLTLSEAIPIAVEIAYDSFYTEILEAMLRILSKGNLIFSPGSTARILENLRAIPNRFAIDVDNIERQIRDAQNPKPATDDATQQVRDAQNSKPATDDATEPVRDAQSSKKAADDAAQ